MTTEQQINAATLRNLTDDEFIRLFEDSGDPLLVEAVRRLQQRVEGTFAPRNLAPDVNY